MKNVKMPPRFCLRCGHMVSGRTGFNASSNHFKGCPYRTLVKPPKEEPKHKRKHSFTISAKDLEGMEFD